MVINCDNQYQGIAADNTVNEIAGEDLCFSCWFREREGVTDQLDYYFWKFAGNRGYLCSLARIPGTSRMVARFGMYDFGTGDTYEVWSYYKKVDDGLWHHLAIRIDRDGPIAHAEKMYVDGVDWGRLMELDMPATVANTGTFGIGTEPSARVKGKICDLKFLKGGLWTPTEIQYQFEHPWDYCPRAGAITEYWRLDEGKGTRLEGSDLHDLTLSNVAAWDRDGPLLPVTVGYGPEMAASTVVDNGITLTANTDNTHGSTLDIGANTRPQSVLVRLQVTIENQEGAPTDGYDVDIRVQNSRDNSNWPDDGRGQPLGNFTADAAGADLTRSAAIEFVPKCRYARLELDNNNGTDDLVFTSRMAKITMQGK